MQIFMSTIMRHIDIDVYMEITKSTIEIMVLWMIMMAVMMEIMTTTAREQQ